MRRGRRHTIEPDCHNILSASSDINNTACAGFLPIIFHLTLYGNGFNITASFQEFIVCQVPRHENNGTGGRNMGEIRVEWRVQRAEFRQSDFI